MEQMAKLLGLRGASGYQRYEDPEKFKKPFLPIEKARGLLPLVNTGDPPIQMADLYMLSGSGTLTVIELKMPSENKLRSLRENGMNIMAPHAIADQQLFFELGTYADAYLSKYFPDVERLTFLQVVGAIYDEYSSRADELKPYPTSVAQVESLFEAKEPPWSEVNLMIRTVARTLVPPRLY